MKIEYTIEEQDFIDFQLFTSSKSESVKRSRKRSWIILLVLFIFLSANTYYKGDTNSAIYFAMFGTLILAFYPKFLNWKYKRYYQKFVRTNYANRFGQLETLEITPEFILSKDKVSEGKVNISEIDNISETQNHFFLKVSTGVSLIIPKHRIDNSEHLKKEFESLNVSIIDETDWSWS